MAVRIVVEVEEVRINPIRLQFIPLLWGLFCLFGLGVAVQKLYEFPYPSSGWQGGIVLIAMSVFAFAAIEGWWLSSQREFVIGDEGISIRSWLQIVFGRTGTSIPWNELRGVALIFDSGRKLELRTDSRRISFWAALWDPSSIEEFLQVARGRDIETTMEWEPGK